MNRDKLQTCVLCGGDGYVPARYDHEEEDPYGRHDGDSHCPACNGSGKVPVGPPSYTGPHWKPTHDEQGRMIFLTYDLDRRRMTARPLPDGKFEVILQIGKVAHQMFASDKNKAFEEFRLTFGGRKE